MYTSNDPTVVNQTDGALLNNSAVARSGVSWGAIFAGATAAAALSLILLILGTGLGLSSVSPWSQDGVSATTFGISTIVWITFMSLAASGIGGYIAGRLRTKWVGVHTDEVFFRDTAHGFLAWGVATLVTAMFLTSVIGGIIGGGVKAGASVVGGVASTAGMATQAAASGMDQDNKEQLNYFIESLFRQGPDQSEQATSTQASTNSDTAETTAANNVNGSESFAPRSASSSNQMTSTAQSTAEVTRIFANALWKDGDLPDDDVRYVGQLIAERTDLTQEEAEERVTEVFSRVQQQLEEIATTAKEAADTAREASAYASLWFFVSLLAGAFVASFAATIGGRQRDL